MKMKLNFSLVESLVVRNSESSDNYLSKGCFSVLERNSGYATNCNGRKMMKMKMMMDSMKGSLLERTRLLINMLDFGFSYLRLVETSGPEVTTL
jgi:hypothetical protein